CQPRVACGRLRWLPRRSRGAQRHRGAAAAARRAPGAAGRPPRGGRAGHGDGVPVRAGARRQQHDRRLGAEGQRRCRPPGGVQPARGRLAVPADDPDEAGALAGRRGARLLHQAVLDGAVRDAGVAGRCRRARALGGGLPAGGAARGGLLAALR
ncbi:unnamed protein product, partial [Prorocentrum cordatum]